MDVSGSLEVKPHVEVEPWRAELNQAIEDEQSWGEQQNTEAASILLKLLLTASEDDYYVEAVQAALRIAADYWAKYLPSSRDPLNRPYRMEDRGLNDYLNGLYDLILSQSWLLSYNDPRQQLLVMMLAELRKLPKVTYKSRGFEYQAYHNDPVFWLASDGFWNGKFIGDEPEPEDPKQKEDFVSTCNEWVNFSCFQARYVASGVELADNHLKFAGVDIPLAFKEGLPTGKSGESRLLVALNWIIYAGRIIHDSMAEKNTEQWNLEMWKTWSQNIKHISENGSHNEEVAAALRYALDEMNSIDSKNVEVAKT